MKEGHLGESVVEGDAMTIFLSIDEHPITVKEESRWKSWTNWESNPTVPRTSSDHRPSCRRRRRCGYCSSRNTWSSTEKRRREGPFMALESSNRSFSVRKQSFCWRRRRRNDSWSHRRIPLSPPKKLTLSTWQHL